MTKAPLESWDQVLPTILPTLSEIPTLSGATSQIIINCQTLQQFLSPLYLQTRTPSHHESTHSLATLPGVDKNPIHYPYQPCQPPILEIPSKTEPPYGTMAHWPPRIQLHHQTYPGKDQHTGWWTITPTKYQSRWKWQPRPNTPWTKAFCQYHPPIDASQIIKKKSDDFDPWPPHSRTPRMWWNN